jgi:hypothetical protein
MENIENSNLAGTNEQSFSKKEAAKYLGFCVRKMEYVMERREIVFEKHGKKVVFRRSHLDAYKNKHVVGGQRTLASGATAIIPIKPGITILSVPKYILGSEAELMIRELHQKAREERRLSREGANVVLTVLGGFRDLEAGELLDKYESDAVSAVQRLPGVFRSNAIETMDWAFAVAPVFIDFLSALEAWSLNGRNPGEKIQIRRPFAPLASWPDRMLRCLDVIPEAEFSKSLAEAEEYFGLERRVSQKTDAAISSSQNGKPRNPPRLDMMWSEGVTHYPSDLVPLDVILRRVPESINKVPFGFVGPTNGEALASIILSNFGFADASSILVNEACSLLRIAKLRWLRFGGRIGWW